MKNLDNKHYYILGIWLVVNLIQSIFTGLHSDESYYWMYSENLAWGFFDHPPMAAFLIFLGHTLLPGEIGVRILLVLLSTATLALILNELKEKTDYLFVAVFVFSFPLIHTHIAGFLAIPDIPLLFFTLLFLIAYKKFLVNSNFKIALLLGIITALMIYSKYHAFLVIGLTILSNLKLLRNKYFWLAVVVALVLLIPHILWQISNEFPTFKYHLVERAKPFRLKYVFPNLINQLLMAGPLTGVLIFWKLSKVKIRDKFQRAMIFNILGFYILFFLMSFKNRIEAHWSAAIMPMLMLLTYPLIANDARFKLWFKRLAVPIVFLTILYRIYLALDIIPNAGYTKITFYHREEHALEIKEHANGMKVGFFNNYAAISNYIFYTGDSAVHLSTPTYRFNQYDLWNDEKYAEGDPLFTVQSKNLEPPNLTRMATGQMKGFVTIDKFQSLNGLVFQIEKVIRYEDEFKFEVLLTNNNDHCIYTRHRSNPVLGFMQERKELHFVPLTFSSKHDEIKPGKTAYLKFTIPESTIKTELPLLVYTRSKNNVRGEIISFHMDEISNSKK